MTPSTFLRALECKVNSDEYRYGDRTLQEQRLHA
jgi:hypothetical protein